MLLSSIEDTRQFAQRLGTCLELGQSYAFIGELGSGKTTLVRFIAEVLGSPDEVTSPTFVLQHLYSLPRGGRVEHWDLYRVSAPPLELLDPPDPDALRLVEWADRCPALLKSAAGILYLRLPDDSRLPERRDVTGTGVFAKLFAAE